MEDDQTCYIQQLGSAVEAVEKWRWPVCATGLEIGGAGRLAAIPYTQSTPYNPPPLLDHSLLPEGAPHAPQPAVDLRLPDFGPARRPRAHLQVRCHRHQRAALPAAPGILAGDGG